MDESDLRLRNHTYAKFVELGRAPTVAEMAIVTRYPERLCRIHHALVLQPGATEIRMANPFSAIPTAYRVLVDDRWWYANCAWDAFGVCAALRADGRIETSCADCGEPLSVTVTDQVVDDDSLLFHVLVPAAHWWDDIVFT